ncbi:glycoside hydrolase family 36 protein [Cellulomonas hominis]|uniref:glycoside hydrolase family 36 protein n=1 Tax=Cellulomonas hominis TaxID=156981 RepID=UPI001B92C05C|nr:glycoside hydrolase family 36 protein [Cellulomonas hominis]VTR76587.1 Alpha-galactosidase [Cellulomonas hominis]
MRAVGTVASPRARIYTEGWQSWSPTGWWTPDRPWPAPPAHDVEAAMRRRPGRPVPDGVLRGEGLVVVDPGDGGPVRVYGATDPEGEVPSLDVHVEPGHVTVHADGPVAVAEARDVAAAFAGFADAWAPAAGVAAPRPPAPRVWCSWYQYFEDVTAADVAENVRALDEHELPVDVVQLDDGWLRSTGERLAPRPEFGPVADLVAEIRASGRETGVWLAPFVVGAGSTVAREHPEWLVGDAGFNWGDRLVGLDLTHPGVRGLLTAAAERVRDLGVRYVKADFLYAGAVPGARHDRAASGTEAYRSGLRLLRELLGPDVYLVGCGAPILPSVGLVDAMRVSPDTFHEGAEDGSAGLRGRAPLEARAWQHGRLWANDPDCAVLRPQFALREEWDRVVTRFGGLRSFSDRVAGLDEWGLAAARRLLTDDPPAGPFPDDVVLAAVPR